MAGSRRWLLLATLVVGIVVTPGAWADPPSRVARLGYLQGPVSLRAAGLTEWAPATLNHPLTIGDALWLDRDGWAELHVGSTALRLAPLTGLAFLNLDDRTVQVQLTQGAVLIRLRQRFESELYEIDTPQGAVTLEQPGVYRIAVDPEHPATTVTVRQGSAVIATASGDLVSVRAGEAASSTSGDRPQIARQAAPPPDEWEGWAEARDRREEQAPALRYVSREVTGYQDLDDYGMWRADPAYGAVWVPSAVPAGWAPYRTGHWAWIEPWGWTWIDDAPWGFAPFHYGRWVVIGGAWAWVPGSYVVRPVYAPALVVFLGGPDFVLVGGPAIAWCPLAPGERYLPPYHVSPKYVHNVNVTVVNVTAINVTRITYRNGSVPGGVTAVPPVVFAHARPVAVAALAVSGRALTTAKVLGTTAPLPPVRQSVLGSGVPDGLRGHGVPPESAFKRVVVARTTPPPAPLPFALRQPLLERMVGRPLDAPTVEALRRNAPSTGEAPPVRLATPTAAGKSSIMPPSSPPTPGLRGGGGPRGVPAPIPPDLPGTSSVDVPPGPHGRKALPAGRGAVIPLAQPRNGDADSEPATGRVPGSSAPRPTAIDVPRSVVPPLPLAAPVPQLREAAPPTPAVGAPRVLGPATAPGPPFAAPGSPGPRHAPPDLLPATAPGGSPAWHPQAPAPGGRVVVTPGAPARGQDVTPAPQPPVPQAAGFPAGRVPDAVVLPR